MKPACIALVAALLPGAVLAQSIYKCTDANGNTLISNARVDKNCKPVNSGPDISVPAPKARPAAAAGTPTPAGFPRVQENTQKERDNDRRRILEQELQNEQRNFDQAKRDLAAQEAVRNGDEKNYQKYLERLQPYQERVAQHERNLQALQRELSAMR